MKSGCEVYSHQSTCLRFILALSLVEVPHLGQNLSSSLSSAPHFQQYGIFAPLRDCCGHWAYKIASMVCHGCFENMHSHLAWWHFGHLPSYFVSVAFSRFMSNTFAREANHARTSANSSCKALVLSSFMAFPNSLTSSTSHS